MAETRKSTLVLVAELAGVSIASVSRVMNGLPASQRVTERVRQHQVVLGAVPVPGFGVGPEAGPVGLQPVPEVVDADRDRRQERG